MAFNKKNWIDREVQYPDRRTLVDINTNVTKTYDVTRTEGYIYKDGTQLNASNFNDLENRIDIAFQGVQDKLTPGEGITISEEGVISVSFENADEQEY